MLVERIAHDESHGSNPNQNGTAFRQNDRQCDFPRHRHVVAALGHFQELLRQIPTSTWAAVTKASGAREHIFHFADNVVA
jgi:hypothetical protein